MPVETQHDADLPRRTWRRWWLAWPKWVRIGVWAFLGVLALHVALAVRITVGLIESEDVTRFRRRPRGPSSPYVGFFNGLDNRPEWFRGQRMLLEGLYGRSNANVSTIMLDRASEADLKYIGNHFPNLVYLELHHPELTADGLAALHSCRKLKHLETQYADLDDGAVQQLAGFDQLETLALGGLVSPKIFPLLTQFPRLKTTKISPLHASMDAAKSAETTSETLQLIVRWADGERSANVNLGYQLVVEVPHAKDGIRIRPFDASDRLLDFQLWPKYHLKDCGDGDYCFYFRLGKFPAEPVTVNIVDGVAAANRLEFVMPVTKAEALKSNR